MYDIIISGSGPAGASAAIECAKEGLKVLLFEKNKLKPRFEKPCGGAIPKCLVNEFNINKKVLENEIIGHNIYAPNGKQCDLVRHGQNWGYIVRRSKFDAYLVEKAINSGVEVRGRSSVQDVIIKNGKIIGVKVKESNNIKEYYSNIVIAADGVGSKIAVKAGLRDKWSRDDLGYCSVAFVEGFKGDIEKNLKYNHVYISNRIAPNCYAWIFPLSENLVNMGVALYNTEFENPMNYLLKFVKWNKIKEKFNYTKILWKNNYAVPYNGIKTKLVDDGIICIGDAAGFVSPYSGEGISYGMYSGKFAGETCALAYNRDDFSVNTLREFRKKCRKNNFYLIFSSHLAFRNSVIKDLENKFNIIIDLTLENQKIKEFLTNIILSEGKNFSEELFIKSYNLFQNSVIKQKFSMIWG
ncbi:MAG: NAD(P)/FAD-dependent oxidoreductase [Candidatus Helarchaeota archaeon]